MADINYSINVNVSKGALQQNVNASNITTDMATAGILAVTLDLGTATQAISTVTLSAVGLCLARSLSGDTTGTSTVSFGRLSGTTLFAAVRLKPGEAGLFRLSPGNYAAVASNAGQRLLLQVLED
jgi:hypothetical protein